MATGAANSKPTSCSSPITSSCIRCWARAIAAGWSAPSTRFFVIRMKTAAGASIRRPIEHHHFGVKAYLALKLMGWSKDHPVLVKAREWILANGGVTECNTFTKIYLCFMGQYDYDAVPAVPPEIVLFPKWFYFNIYEISSWSRAILVPLSIAYAKKPFKKTPPEQGIDELFVGGRQGSTST